MEREAETNAFNAGMAIAAGIVMSVSGDDTIAAEILGAAGLTTVAAMRKAGVETYDIRLCAPVLRLFREQEKSSVSRKARSALAKAGISP